VTGGKSLLDRKAKATMHVTISREGQMIKKTPNCPSSQKGYNISYINLAKEQTAVAI
jgi:hypothetical protein